MFSGLLFTHLLTYKGYRKMIENTQHICTKAKHLISKQTYCSLDPTMEGANFNLKSGLQQKRAHKSGILTQDFYVHLADRLTHIYIIIESRQTEMERR